MLTLVLQSAGFEKANKVYRIIRLPTPTVHKMKTARNLDHLLRFTQWSLFPCSEAHSLFQVVFYILDGFPERTFFQKDERRVEGIDEQRASERGMQDMKKGLQQHEMMNMLCNISIQDRPHGLAVQIRGPVLKRTQRKRRVTTETDALYPPHDRQLVYIFMQKSVGGIISARFEVFEVDNVFSISSL